MRLCHISSIFTDLTGGMRKPECVAVKKMPRRYRLGIFRRNGTIAAVINLADFVFIQITKVVAETPTCKFEIKKSPLKRGK